MVDLDLATWASPTDVSGTYGLNHVVCEEVTFGRGGSHALSWWRSLLRAVSILERL